MENPAHRPQCLGFIMDGNRRWAKDQGLEAYEGHKQGGEVLRSCVEWLATEQIPHAVFYAFSTENWARSEIEVSYLMDLFREWLRTIGGLAKEHNVRIKIVGRREDFAPDIVTQMNELEVCSAAESDEHATTVWMALSYGGRTELVEAVNQAIKNGEAVTEESFETLLWTAGLPDPDMIIRTSGEQRLSNFLTWKSTYSELYFIEKHWPALTRDDFEDILAEYGRRNRRRGK